MKSNKFLIFATALTLFWEVFFGHIGGLGLVNLLLCFSIIFFLKWSNKRAYLLWLVIMTLLVDFFQVYWFGFSLIYLVGAILSVKFVDRFFKIIDSERYFIVYALSVLFSEFIIYLLYIMDGDSVSIMRFVYSFIVNLIMMIILGIISSRYFNDRSIIV